MAMSVSAQMTVILEYVGKHDFPVSAYPKVGEWLRAMVLAGDAKGNNGGAQ
jgi:hypothetical protein